MSTCQNCKTRLSCGCQVRIASNGKSCCSICLASYENMLKINKVAPGSVPHSPNAPAQVGVKYNGTQQVPPKP